MQSLAAVPRLIRRAIGGEVAAAEQPSTTVASILSREGIAMDNRERTMSSDGRRGAGGRLLPHLRSAAGGEVVRHGCSRRLQVGRGRAGGARGRK